MHLNTEVAMVQGCIEVSIEFIGQHDRYGDPQESNASRLTLSPVTAVFDHKQAFACSEKILDGHRAGSTGSDGCKFLQYSGRTSCC